MSYAERCMYYGEEPYGSKDHIHNFIDTIGREGGDVVSFCGDCLEWIVVGEW